MEKLNNNRRPPSYPVLPHSYPQTQQQAAVGQPPPQTIDKAHAGVILRSEATKNPSFNWA